MVANNVKFYRQMNGLSCEQMAKKMGCSARWISKFDTHYLTPPIDTAYELAAFFGLTVYDLFWFVDQPEPEKKLAVIGSKAATAATE